MDKVLENFESGQKSINDFLSSHEGLDDSELFADTCLLVEAVADKLHVTREYLSFHIHQSLTKCPF